MSNLVADSISIYRKLEYVYKESVYKTLQTPTDELKKIFNDLLDSRSQDFFLKKSNSVYDTKYYYIKTRIKDPSSFYEKLVRKELGIKLTSKLGLLSKTEDTIHNKKGEIVAAINKLDDIIGLRIVTELKEDCNNVLKLLLNSADVFLAHGIQIDDLNSQPQRMRNGLDIIRIKGIYQNLYGFELQIKSKINETWGDLDHTLFYKDYSISPIKDTVQITMNNVGILLDKIENLLYDLRESGGNYNNNADHLQMQKALEDELSPLLKASYGVTYNIKELSFYLFHFRSKLNIGEKKLTALDFDYVNISPQQELIRKYVEIRNTSLVLTTLEGVYINWLALEGNTINPENVDTAFHDYIQLLSGFIKSDISSNNVDFDDYMKTLILYNSDAEIFLSPKKHFDSIAIFNRLIEVLSDLNEDKETPKEVAHLFCVHFFNGDYKRYLQKCIDEELNLNDALINIKDQVTASRTATDIVINNIVIDILENLTV